MFHRLIALLLIAFSFSCSEKKKPAIEKTYPGAVGLSGNRIGAELQRINDTLRYLHGIPDSAGSYQQYCRAVADSVKTWFGDADANENLTAIIDQRNLSAPDSTILKIIGKAYIRLGYNLLKDRSGYTDTLVYLMEEFLRWKGGDTSWNVLAIAACNYLGIQNDVLGDHKKSAFYYQEMMRMANEIRDESSYYSGLSNQLIALNEMGYADSVIAIVRKISFSHGVNPQRIALINENLAEALLAKKQYADVIIVCSKTLAAITDSLHSGAIDSGEFMDCTYKIHQLAGDAFLQLNSVTIAKQYYKRATEYLLTICGGKIKDRRVGKLFNGQIDLLLRNGELEEALLLCQKALYCVSRVDSTDRNDLPELSELYPENTIMEVLDKKAEILEYKCSGSNADTSLLQLATRCYELSSNVEIRLMREFEYDESLSRQSLESKNRSQRAIADCYRLYTITKNKIWAEKAFAFAEGSKAIVLQESANRSISANAALRTDSTWQHVLRLRQLVTYYEKEIATAEDDHPARIAKLKEGLRDAERQLLLAKSALTTYNRQYREAVAREDYSLERIRDELLDENTVLIEYFSGDHAHYIFQLDNKTNISFGVLDSSTASAAKDFLFFFTDRTHIINEPARYRIAANRLFERLKLDSITRTPHENYLIIPDGILNLIPFDALVTDTGTGTNLKTFSYLARAKEISYGFSSAALIKQSEAGAATGHPISCFAPVFPSAERGLAPLLFSEEELNSIREEKPNGNFFLHEKASLENFKKAAQDEIIHIASHANADTGATIPAIEFFDSTLYLNEIYNLTISAHLVVLSACETGIGKLDKSEGSISIARAFYYAGAQNVVTSLWSVDDKSTGILFRDFYRRLNGNNYGHALAMSKIDYLQHATEFSASPYYWASFIHIGHSTPSKQRQFPFLPAVFILAGLSIAIVYFRRRKK